MPEKGEAKFFGGTNRGIVWVADFVVRGRRGVETSNFVVVNRLVTIVCVP
jgi:hypothetical protein